MKNPIILSFVTLLLSIGISSCTEDDDLENNPNDSNTSQPTEQIGEAIDLGLPSGNLWSSCNIGAKSIKEYGYYYAWGETDTKNEYSLASYIHYDNQWQNYINIGDNISESNYDIVSAMWGNDWHMPNEADFRELIEHCKWEWIKYENSIWGYKIEGKNGNKIFLPATGYYQDTELIDTENYGYYWSGSLSNNKSSEAISLCIDSNGFNLNTTTRFCGLAIRPVKSIPEWKSLGYASFRDSYFFKNKYDVEIQQSNKNPNKFRLIQPYLAGFSNPEEGYSSDEFSTQEMDSSFVFRVFHSGESINGVNTSKDGLVAWNIYNTGYFNSKYSDWIHIISPAAFSNFDNEEQILFSSVTSWQDNGLPAQIQLAPWYYMMNVGGYDYSYDPQITITFPGVTIPDYFIKLKRIGQHTDNNTDYIDFDVIMGDDVAYVKVGMAKTDDFNSVYNGIIDGSINSVKMTNSGMVSFALSGSGTYTAYAIIYGPRVPQNGYGTQFEYTKSEWKSLGMAQYTDGIMTSLFKINTLTYVVEIQESEDSPGLYRLVNPYGAAFQYNEPGDWDDSKDYYMEINAVDPQGVYIETQSLGFDWGYGMFSVSSMAAYQIDNYGLTLEQCKTAGICGTLNNGVITFPTQALMVTAPDLGGWYYANVAYDENDQPIPGSGSFKVVLPSASASASKSLKAVNSTKAVNKKDIAGKKLRKMDKQLPVKVQLKK